MNDKNKIMVFDQGVYIGMLDRKDHEETDYIMTLIKITLPDNNTSTVLYFKDMDYGIIIPDTITSKIYDILEVNKNER